MQVALFQWPGDAWALKLRAEEGHLRIADHTAGILRPLLFVPPLCCSISSGTDVSECQPMPKQQLGSLGRNSIDGRVLLDSEAGYVVLPLPQPSQAGMSVHIGCAYDSLCFQGLDLCAVLACDSGYMVAHRAVIMLLCYFSTLGAKSIEFRGKMSLEVCFFWRQSITCLVRYHTFVCFSVERSIRTGYVTIVLLPPLSSLLEQGFGKSLACASTGSGVLILHATSGCGAHDIRP